jgi:3D (Asp-Asp-Asp) domain-containing protein
VGVLATCFCFAVVCAALARSGDARAPRLAARRSTLDESQATGLSADRGAAAARPAIIPLRLPELPAATRSDAGKTARSARRNPTKARRELFKVTAYCPCRKCCGAWSGDGKTASGRSIRYNGGCFVAADTRVLPFMTKLSVPGYAGGAPVPVIDRGRNVRGRHIDLFFRSHRQAKRWGSRKMWITIYR